MALFMTDRTEVKEKLTSFAHTWATKVKHRIADGSYTSMEKQEAQTMWGHLLRCFNVLPEELHLFEVNATRASTGNNGWIDILMSGTFIGEAKSPGEKLDIAYSQIQDYLNGGSIKPTEFPKYALLSNFEYFRIIRLDGTEPIIEFPVEHIPDYYDQLLFIVGQEPITKEEQEEASIQAAGLMANLYNSILGENSATPTDENEPMTPEEEDERTEQVSVLLTRLLFLMYGDDSGLWETNLFHRWVEFETTADSLGGQLSSLFNVLNTPDSKRSKNVPELMNKFRYVNGGIFSQTIAPEFFTPETREALLDACRFRWDHIDVSVFGAMFQLVKSKEARRAAGEHYTSEKDILKTIGPLFYDEYRAEADRLIKSKSTSDKDFDAFLDKLASNVYCDPACGGGNFLNVAYAKLREIETDILVEQKKRTKNFHPTLDIALFQKISIDQFYGFEINWWAAKIAETAMFLVDHQANLRLSRDYGNAPERLPIKIAAHIIHHDALALDWRETIPSPAGATFIFGNPPFIGQKEKAADPQKVKMMKEVWGKDYDGYLDFVTAWFKKAADYFKQGNDRSTDRTGEFAFVSTNSISQGQPVPALYGVLFRAGWNIKFAYQTFPWNSEAPGQASVHCVIVGFTRESNFRPRLFGYNRNLKETFEYPKVRNINAYLIEGPNVLVTKRTDKHKISKELPVIMSGSVAYDWDEYSFDEDTVAEVKADPIASKYLRLYMGGFELINNINRWCLWLENLDPQDVKKSTILRERIETVRDKRAASNRAGTKKSASTPHIFGENRQPKTQYLAMPQTFAEGRYFYTAKVLPADVIANKKLFTAEDPDGFLFAIISSSMFMAWQKAVGGRLKSDPSFSNTIVWNNLPLPEVDSKTRSQIIAAGKAILIARENINSQADVHRSLADMYNPFAMDKDLMDAHKKLDRVVDKAFGATKLCTSENQRLEILFDSYAKMTATN